MKKKAKELQVGDRLKLRPSECLGHPIGAPSQDVEIAEIRRQSNSGGVRVTVWVVGQEKAYAWLRGSTLLTVSDYSRTIFKEMAANFHSLRVNRDKHPVDSQEYQQIDKQADELAATFEIKLSREEMEELYLELGIILTSRS